MITITIVIGAEINRKNMLVLPVRKNVCVFLFATEFRPIWLRACQDDGEIRCSPFRESLLVLEAWLEASFSDMEDSVPACRLTDFSSFFFLFYFML